MEQHAWIKEFPAAVTVSDQDGIILEMNDRAAKTFAKDGGYAAHLSEAGTAKADHYQTE